MVLWHLGSLHPVETWLTLLLAFGPVALLWVAVRTARRRERGAESSAQPDGVTAAPPATADRPGSPP